MQKNITLFRALFALLLSISTSFVIAQCPGFPSMVQTKHTVDISTYVKGYLEYLPPDYNSTNGHPLIIYFHGTGEVGDGTATSLCNLMNPGNSFDIVFPKRIEQGNFTPSVTFGGNTYSYVIMSPQYNRYTFPTDYPGAADVEAVIDYAVAHYGNKININRIYLTGMSAGSNMIVNYVSSSLTRAGRVAAVFPVALCLIDPPSGTSNIASANLAYWGVHCAIDPSGCDFAFHQNWVNAINANVPPPSPLAKLTSVAGCNAHNVWNNAYDPTYTDAGLNFYNWIIQFSRNFALPANLKSYSVRLDKSKAIVEWTTTNEQNTDYFALERAGANQNFEKIGEIAAAGNSAVEKKYTLLDDQPSAGTNLYRLALVNMDGRKEYFETKKIVVPTKWSGKAFIPNPVKGNLTIYINIDKTENLHIKLFDLNGKLLKKVTRDFSPGLTENKIDVSALSHGTYLVRIDGESFTMSKKIIIN